MRRFNLFSAVLVLILPVLLLAFYGCGSGVAPGSDDSPAEPTYTTVSGTVVDFNGKAIKEAEVTIYSEPQTVMTDAFGYFEAEVETGDHSYTIKVKSGQIGKGTFTCNADEHMELGNISTIHNKIYSASGYFPLDVGTTWEYSYLTATVENEHHEFSGRQGVRVDNLGQWCDDRSLFMAHDEEGLIILGYYDGSEYGEFDMDEAFLFLPAALEVGKTWQIDSNEGWTATLQLTGTEDIVANNINYEYALKINAIVKVGLFESYSTTFWFAEHVGIVKVLRYDEKPLGYEGCWMVTSENPAIELQNYGAAH